MKIKLIVVVILTLLILSLSGCAPDQGTEQNDYVDISDISEEMGEGIGYNAVETNQFLESEQLRERLLQAIAVELRNTENITIGMVRDEEKIGSLIEGLFTYKIEEDYTINQQGQVVGPMNFYFADGGDIYGLMNNEYVYIEGFYFMINNRKSQQLQSFFSSNTAPEPVTGE